MNEGEMRLSSLGLLTSGAKAELGEESGKPAVVAQAAPAPVCETVQPAGRAGGITASKFSERSAEELNWPSRSGNETDPKAFGPSCKVRVAIFVPLQLP